MLNWFRKMKTNKLLNVLAFLSPSGTGWSVRQAEKTGEASSRAGAKKNAMCIGCHGTLLGYHAGLSRVHKVPKIAGQSAGTVVGLAQHKKAGRQSTLPCAGWPDSPTEQDMADPGAYYDVAGGRWRHMVARGRFVKVSQPKPWNWWAGGGCTACRAVSNFEDAAGSQPSQDRRQRTTCAAPKEHRRPGQIIMRCQIPAMPS